MAVTVTQPQRQRAGDLLQWRRRQRRRSASPRTRTAVTTVTASDADPGATLTYSIAGGADAAKFSIDATTGALSFVTAPDHETPADAGGNNVYDVVVQVVRRNQHRQPGHRGHRRQPQRQCPGNLVEWRRGNGGHLHCRERDRRHHRDGDRRRSRRYADLFHHRRRRCSQVQHRCHDRRLVLCVGARS